MKHIITFMTLNIDMIIYMPYSYLLEYMSPIMLCYVSLYGGCAISACWPAGKTSYKMMLRIMK